MCRALGLDALITYYQSTEDDLPIKLTKPCKCESRLLILPPITIFAGFENILHTSLHKGKSLWNQIEED